ASITTRTRTCEYCQSEILVKSFNSLTAMPLPQVNKYMATYKAAAAEHPEHQGVSTSIGLCLLKLKKYDQAIEVFEKAQLDNFDDATPYFYAAVARLKGRKPFLCARPEIDKMEEDLNAALSIGRSAEQLYFLSYIGRDYFRRKFLRHEPAWEGLMDEAVGEGLSPSDVEAFHAMVGTPVDISLD
ncbi:MAG: tetratricopeptide repeat protein, partial [Bacteroidaceae bacterium]|nr:tetratricopeptide repeat protein [Bacteroidaceae bacterium]